MNRTINPHVFLEALRTTDKYRQNLIQIAPSIQADIVSFASNPNCGCKGKIHKYMVDHIHDPQISSFLSDMKKDIPNVLVETVELTKQETKPVTNTPTKNKPMSGHVVEIPASPSEYMNLIQVAQKDNWEYKGASVMERKNLEGETIWLVFFY